MKRGARLARQFMGAALLLITTPLVQAQDARLAPVDTVHVALPTGEREADRATILAALERLRPGGTVQFAPGTYLIGPGIEVTTPDVTLLGHPDGTTIRGCRPEEFVPFEIGAGMAETAPPRICNALALSAGRQIVRNLLFEYAWHGLLVGCCLAADMEALERGERPTRAQPGGHLIEGNTFRYTPNGLRVVGKGEAVTVVRGNRFVDVYHAIGINGGPVHFLDNDISVQHPERVPISSHPGDAINVLPEGPPGDHTSCTGNVIEGNRIEGHTHGIGLLVAEPATSCRGNTIRNNTIVTAGRVRYAEVWEGLTINVESDSTLAGVPLSVINYVAAFGVPADSDSAGVIENNLIEGNRIIGADGLGIEVVHASNNRIVDNAITDVRLREPFPGNVLIGTGAAWEVANGSGIWLSPGSSANEIAGNVFEDVAVYAVVVEDDSNRVALGDPADAVRDLGAGNRVDRPVEQATSAEEVRHRGRLVAVVRTTTSQADGEQAYVTLFEGGAASGLVVVSFEGGRLFGTIIPDTWGWVDEDTVEVCGPTTTLRNEVGFPPPGRDCGVSPITGKELDLDGDGSIDLIETVTVLHPQFYADRPSGNRGR